MTADTAALRSMLDDAADRATFYGTRPGMVHLWPETVRALCDAADEAERRLPCDAGCTEYAEEECSRHGRPVSEVWTMLTEAVAANTASRTAHAALVAGIETGLRESACAECDHDRCATYRSAASWVRDYAALDHHAPTTGATP